MKDDKLAYSLEEKCCSTFNSVYSLLLSNFRFKKQKESQDILLIVITSQSPFPAALSQTNIVSTDDTNSNKLLNSLFARHNRQSLNYGQLKLKRRKDNQQRTTV
jgi:hypothetical protein